LDPYDDPELDPRDEPEAVDLHGLGVEQALRRVAQALHAARVRRLKRLLIVTGAGWGNPDQKPVLRPKVEAWLRGPEGRALGVKDVRRVHRDGALDVLLRD
jgi:DNA-nicking Smr family endonuclease